MSPQPSGAIKSTHHPTKHHASGICSPSYKIIVVILLVCASLFIIISSSSSSSSSSKQPTASSPPIATSREPLSDPPQLLSRQSHNEQPQAESKDERETETQKLTAVEKQQPTTITTTTTDVESTSTTNTFTTVIASQASIVNNNTNSSSNTSIGVRNSSESVSADDPNQTQKLTVDSPPIPAYLREEMRHHMNLHQQKKEAQELAQQQQGSQDEQQEQLSPLPVPTLTAPVPPPRFPFGTDTQKNTGVRNPRLRIAVVTFASFDPVPSKRVFAEELTAYFHKLGWINKKSYCDRWQYDYVLENATEIMRDDPRPKAWGKIKTLMKFLPLYDWVMWMDADSLVMNFNITIESILQHAWNDQRKFPSDPERPSGGRQQTRNELESMHQQQERSEKSAENLNKFDEAVAAKEAAEGGGFRKEEGGGTVDLLMARDWNGINSGVFLLRNSDWSMRFLKRVNRGLDVNACPLPATWWEQRVMMCLFDERRSRSWIGKDERHVMMFETQRLFNSYGPPTDEGHASAAYRRGDFVAHFPNCKAFARCTYYFKQHFKDALEMNKQYFAPSYLIEYKLGTHVLNYPLTWYPPRYWNFIKHSPNRASLYRGGDVKIDEQDHADEHFAGMIDNGASIYGKRRNRRHTTSSSANSSSPYSQPLDSEENAATRTTRLKQRGSGELQKQKNFTMPPRKSYREQARLKKLKEEEEEEAIRKKRDRMKKMNKQQRDDHDPFNGGPDLENFGNDGGKKRGNDEQTENIVDGIVG